MMKLDYRQFYEDLQEELITLLADTDKHLGVQLKEIIEKVKSKQKRQVGWCEDFN